jgi:uncharacterized protein YrrD
MLRSASELKGYPLEASDGAIGKINDCLFDDGTWKLRWLVVETGSWLTGREVLIHPSSITAIDDQLQTLAVELTQQKVKDSPETSHDRPVSRRMERSLYGYYGWPAYVGCNFYGAGAIASPFSARPYFGGVGMGEADAQDPSDDDADPHLRSLAEVVGYHIHARDGEIGHIEDLIIDDQRWYVSSLVIDTANWWAGQQVLVSPQVVRDIRWGERQMQVELTRDQIKASPPRETLNTLHGQIGLQQRVHQHSD